MKYTSKVSLLLFSDTNKWTSEFESPITTGNTCTGVGGAAGTVVWSWATCCSSQSINTVSFDCYRVRSHGSGINTGDIAEVGCDVINDGYDYFLTSCSTITSWRNTDGWWIEDNKCKGRNHAAAAPAPVINADILSSEAIWYIYT